MVESVSLHTIALLYIEKVGNVSRTHGIRNPCDLQQSISSAQSELLSLLDTSCFGFSEFYELKVEPDDFDPTEIHL